MSQPETVIPSSQITATITAAARAIYPHDALPDDVYARVPDKLAETAREDSGAARLIEDGVSALNGGLPFAELSANEQLEALKGIECGGRIALWPRRRRACRPANSTRLSGWLHGGGRAAQ